MTRLFAAVPAGGLTTELARAPADGRTLLFASSGPAVLQRLAAGGVIGATGAKGFGERLAREVAYWRPGLKKLGISEH
jgi:hypothetical protein